MLKNRHEKNQLKDLNNNIEISILRNQELKMQRYYKSQEYPKSRKKP